MIPKKLKVFAFFFATFLAGAFVGGSTVEVINQSYQVDMIPYPTPPASEDLLDNSLFHWGPSDMTDYRLGTLKECVGAVACADFTSADGQYTISDWNEEAESEIRANIHKDQEREHGTSIGMASPQDCYAALCIGPLGWGIDVDSIATNFDDKNKRVHIYPNEDDGIVWADIHDPNTSTMPSFGEGSFYVEAEYGAKIRVIQRNDGHGYQYDIYAMPDKEAIYGDTNKRAEALARSLAGNAADPAVKQP